jgi:hypothetical protein
VPDAIRAVVRHPVAVLVVVAVLTAGFAGLATQLRTDTEITSYAPDTERARALDRVGAEFGAGGQQVQVVLDAGADGNVLGPGGVRAAVAVTRALRQDPVVGPALAAEGAVTSWATPLVQGLEARGLTLDDLDDTTLATAIEQAPADAIDPVRGLVSADLDPRARTARAGIVVATLDPALTPAEASPVGVEAAEVARAAAPAGFEVTVIGDAVINALLGDAVTRELPTLLAWSSGLVLVLLALTYRNVSDVVIAVTALGIAIVWALGAAALLGPDLLDLTGPFTQTSSIVPVLLVGLGVDYAIHLTSRYRDEADDHPPPEAAAISLRTVGGALVLTTATTAVAFLTNVVSPLPPVQDFGIFVAAGIVAAFVVMTTFAPATRILVDRWRIRRGREPDDQPVEEGRTPLAAVGTLSAPARRAPWVTVAAAAAVTVVAGVGAMQVGSSFSRESFLPDGGEAVARLDRVAELFGEGVGERTFALLDGDVARPEVVRALAAAEEDLRSLPATRSDAAAVISPASLLDAVAEQAGEGTRDRLRELGWGPDGVTDDADVAALFDVARQVAPRRAAQVLGDDPDLALVSLPTAVGDDAAELGEEVRSALSPVREAGVATTVTSQGLVVDQTAATLTDTQARSIAITLGTALALLMVWFWVDRRSLRSGVVAGLVTMIPSLLVVVWVIGAMAVLDLPFNPVTATIAAVAIGIGVDYGIHVTRRFEEQRDGAGLDDALDATIRGTGTALVASASTTAAGFGVLVISALAPIRQFGAIVALAIVGSVIAAVLVQPALLHLTDRWVVHPDRGS